MANNEILIVLQMSLLEGQKSQVSKEASSVFSTRWRCRVSNDGWTSRDYYFFFKISFNGTATHTSMTFKKKFLKDKRNVGVTTV